MARRPLAHLKPHDGGPIEKPPLGSLLEHMCAAATLEACPKCDRVAVTGEVCEVCWGGGWVTVERADKWRAGQGVPLKRGPLPPMGDPPTIPPK